FTIDRATPSVTVTPVGTYTYSGSPQGPGAATNTGTGTSYTFSYSGTDNANNSYGPSATKPINAGSYTVTATVAASADGNYTSASSSATAFTIDRATPSVTVTPVGTYTYSGSPQGPWAATNTGTGTSYTFSYSGTDNANHSYGPSATKPTNAGNYTVTATVAASADGNYSSASSSATAFTIDKATPTVTVTPVGTYTYNGSPQGPGAATNTGTGSSYTFSYTGTDNAGNNYAASSTKPTNAGNYTVTATVAASADGNWASASSSATAFTIDKKDASVTPNNNSKYCGQSDLNPVTSGTLLGFITSDNVSVTYSRVSGESAGNYKISATLSPTGVLSNYNIAYNTATFTINGIASIDASGSSNAWSLNNSKPDTLKAQITPAVGGVTVIFTVTPGNTYSTTTDASGLATVTFTGYSVGLYKVSATAGASCATSTDAYFSVYDPNAGFVTGGGWIMSPAGAYSLDLNATGKANFGFNSQYKKGSNVPTGNTQFQFQAGNLNFNSSSYNSGSLVIAGPKAIFQGVGTINGSGSYNFMVSAIDGSISGGGGSDKFRIKIWNSTTTIYDNMMGIDNNSDPITVLGGGSIVIHSTSSNKTALDNNLRTIISNEPTQLAVKVLPNPTSYYFTLGLKSASNEKVSITVVDIMGRTVEQRSNVPANSTLQLGNSYHPGIYFAQVVQGKDMVLLKLIKEGK
ncbi:T9SS type A sorting domain-containing protein, partial [Ginsengibacter hankyongi]